MKQPKTLLDIISARLLCYFGINFVKMVESEEATWNGASSLKDKNNIVIIFVMGKEYQLGYRI